MVKLTFLGTGGGMPMPNRHLSSVVLNYRGRKILIDSGEGTQIWNREYGLGFKSFDIILITHAHGDHINGLNGLLATIGNSGREEDITIIGPEGIKEVVEGLIVTCRYLPFKLDIVEAKEEEFNFFIEKDKLCESSKEDSEVTINTKILEHSATCIGYRLNINRKRKFDVEKAMLNNVPKLLWSRLQKEKEVIFEGKTYYPNDVLGGKRRGISISYVTDTRPIEAIIPFISESDLFIVEGTYGDDLDIEKAIKNKHMTFREGARLGKIGRVKELIYTHFSPALLDPYEYLNNGKEEFENVRAAYDGLELEFKFID